MYRISTFLSSNIFQKHSFAIRGLHQSQNKSLEVGWHSLESGIFRSIYPLFIHLRSCEIDLAIDFTESKQWRFWVFVWNHTRKLDTVFLSHNLLVAGLWLQFATTVHSCNYPMTIFDASFWGTGFRTPIFLRAATFLQWNFYVSKLIIISYCLLKM